jgi:hypothetical protein
LKNEDGKDFIEIDVKPYDVLISYQGKYYYRSGSTKQELKGNALNNLLLKKLVKHGTMLLNHELTSRILTFPQSKPLKKELPQVKDCLLLQKKKT